jgi:hypothetical protein
MYIRSEVGVSRRSVVEVREESGSQKWARSFGSLDKVREGRSVREEGEGGGGETYNADGWGR